MGRLSGTAARPGVRPVFALLWLGGTVLSFPLGTTLGMSILYLPMAILVGAALQVYAAVRGDIGFTGDAVYFAGLALGGITGTGIVVGVAQWLILRKRVSKAGWWVIATGTGYFLGAITGFLVNQALARVPGLPGRVAAVLTFAAAGAVVGLLQGLVLRRHVSRAVWWVMGSSVGFGLAYAVGLGIRALVAAPPSETSVAGLVSGMATLFLGPQGGLAFAAIVALTTAATLVSLWEAPVWPAVRPTAALVAAGLIFAVGYSRLGGGATSVESRVLSGHNERIFAVAWSPNGTRLVSRDGNGHIYVWDASTGRVVTRLVEDGGPTTVVYWNIWYPDSAKRVVIEDRKFVGDLLWSPDGRLLAATGFADDSVRLLDGTTGVVQAELRGLHARVVSVAWATDGKSLASAGEEGTIGVWDISGRQLAVMNSPDVAQIAWSPDGSLLAASPVGAGQNEVDIRIWDVRTASEVRSLRMAPGIPRPMLSWSHDGKYLAVPGGGVYVWETSTWMQTAYLRYPVSVSWIAWSPNAPRLAVVVSNTIRVWDATTRREMVMRGHSGDVFAVAWSPDGKRLASGSTDRTVRIWMLP